MEPLQITEKIKEAFPAEVLGVTEFRGQVSVHLKREKVLDICRFLHDTPELAMDYLMDLCGVDYLGKKDDGGRFEVVYHLYSMEHRHMLRLRVRVPGSDPKIASVMPVWKGVNWHERECFDMFGIVFEGHPDLRRILLPEDWEGHPLRKDYPVQGRSGDEEWRGFKEVLEISEKLKEFEWER